ncbi:hypothetical protein IMZ48_43145 [Candidatus Bathyarchaeota archaeon]|nr:hypothetical protein [Candidatus Bathyarchaeota archaeon]
MYAGALGVGLGDEAGYAAAAELEEGGCYSYQSGCNERAEDLGVGLLRPLAVLARLVVRHLCYHSEYSHNGRSFGQVSSKSLVVGSRDVSSRSKKTISNTNCKSW